MCAAASHVGHEAFAGARWQGPERLGSWPGATNTDADAGVWPTLRGGVVDAPLVSLHNRLREMHRLRDVDPAAFRASYEARAQEAVRLAESANYKGYALRQGEPPCALHYAAGCGCLEACTSILQRCERLNFVADTAGQTALFWAAQSGLRSTVSLLIRYGADVAHVDREGRAPLHLAAANGFPHTCGLLLAAHVRSIGSCGRPCLELKTCRQGETPLHLAARYGHVEVVHRLLESAADPSERTVQGRTPLHLAAMAGHAFVVQRLLEVAEPGVQPPMLVGLSDTQGMRAVDYAAERDWEEATWALAGEELAQEELRTEWRTRFEPECRAFLNVPMCEAFLEIGRPEVLAVEHLWLRLECRIVDALGLIERYSVEVCSAGFPKSHADTGNGSRKATSTVEFCRDADQEPIDDVEFRIPKFIGNTAVWNPGAISKFRVVGLLAPTAQAKAAYPCSQVHSAWTLPLRLPAQR